MTLARRPHHRSLAAATVLAVIALGVAGCKTDQVLSKSTMPDDPVTRHPIEIREGLVKLDVMPGGGPGGLTDRQYADVRAFGSDWRRQGRGPITIQLPVGGSSETQSAYSASAIRTALIAGGAAPQAVREARYAASNPNHLAPVRLTFAKLEAKVATKCGQWPENAGDGDWQGGLQNKQFWNFGCASQQNLAAMVADPEDLIRPRAETQAFAPRRAVVVGKYTRGEVTSSALGPYEKTSASGMGN